MLLITPAGLDARRAVASGALASLADSLAADLAPVLARDVYVPEHKALLSRAGGRCERDGTMLEFDPFSPREHKCPLCSAVYTSEIHHRWWVYPYQLWLAERAVHASALHALRGEPQYAALARDILVRYCDVYHTYANRDNALGPTRPFFSTYLESIWLLQLCIATGFLEHAGEQALADDVRARIVQPSVALIASYDEGLSNRQVWNNAAMMAAALLLDDRRGVERVVNRVSGVQTHLRECLLADGTWYEGDNYHQFAHRGLWFCITLAERAGVPIAPDLNRRFDEGFATPFATALPDLTFPARKDSQYAVSLRQWRFAESCELGLARRDDPRLRAALARLYADDIPRGDTGRARSSAEAERNVAPARLSRADLGWRSLLFARTELPELTAATPRSAHLPAQGFTVFRRDRGRVYVALDWGQSGGGHGHPDRLNVMFADGTARWLDDLGTGSYVDQSLHWYRSTLAHNAPLVDGRSQDRINGRLLAHDERGGVGWILASAEIRRGVSVERALVITPDYFVDEVRWTAERNVRIDLPIHFDAEAKDVTFANAVLDGGDGVEDGFTFAKNAVAADVRAGNPVAFTAERDGAKARMVIHADTPARLFRVSAPAQPSTRDARFHVLRCEGNAGVIRSVWCWNERVTDTQFVGDTIDVALGGERHVHRRTPEYWQVEMTAGQAHSGIELYGWTTTEDGKTGGREDGTQLASASINAARVLKRGASLEWELGESHYRRSEASWSEAGKPTARVNIGASANELIIKISASVGPLVFVAPDAVNPLDNEHADINAHGAQVYLRTQANGGAWVIVPERGGSTAHARQLTEWGSMTLRSAECMPRDTGFDLQLAIPLPPGRQEIGVDVIVNETTPVRARRRGQLVLSGANGEFVYLRGDRHDPRRLIPLMVDD